MIRYTIALCIGLLSVGCANYRLNYSGAGRGWRAETPPDSTELAHTLYLIGDAGAGTEERVPSALRALARELPGAGKNTTVVFLGDNLYWDGMAPTRDSAARREDEMKLSQQLGAVADFRGRVFFIAGNHDWYTYGAQGLKRQARFLQKALKTEEDVMLPDPGCGEPTEIELTDELTLLLIDSQWWLENWAGHRDINDGCEIKTREEFTFLLKDILKGLRNKDVIIALHHPPYSNGHHGGQYTLKQHLFPLEEFVDGLYLPLPALGSMAQFLRFNLGDRQDLSHPQYRALRQILLDAARDNERVVFASGHEHSLQYWEKEKHTFVVSGAGSRHSPARAGGGALFGYGGQGLARLDYYHDGQVWASFFRPLGEGEATELIYRRQVYTTRPAINDSLINSYIPPGDSAYERKPLSSIDFRRNRLGRWLWGDHYRDTYADTVQVAMLDLSTFDGGLIPTKPGGGMQTNSLGLENEAGREYTLRALEKDATRTVPYPYNTDLILSIVRDNFSASHPLAALPVAALAESAGLYHTNPRLIYLPPQPALGKYNPTYAGGLYLLEERPSGKKWKSTAHFGCPEDIVSTVELLEKLREEQDHRIDQDWVVRSRLFDLVVGDWDRHDDQWRWSKLDSGEWKVYRPIPRDRDQAFANYDGFLFRIARRTIPKARQWNAYQPLGGPVHWATYNAYRFDQTFLTGLEWRDWAVAVHRLQQQLSNAVIDQALRATLPAGIYERDAPAIAATLRARRDQLLLTAREYYEFLARKVEVRGTDKEDYFLVERLAGDSTRVTVYDAKRDGQRGPLLYRRTFLAGETSEIRLYGLADKDTFDIVGAEGGRIRLRLIGGPDADVFRNASDAARVLVYDFDDDKSEIEPGPGVRDLRSDDPHYNLYSRFDPMYEYDHGFATPILGFNPDDKVTVGLAGFYQTYGFKKSPYSTYHKYSLQYALASKGILGTYTGEFTDIIRQWDLRVDLWAQTPLYAANFYGFGNETVDFSEEIGDVEDDDNYHRIRQRRITIYPALMRRGNKLFSYYFGPHFESVRIDRTEGRFIDVIADELNPDIFDSFEMLSAQAGFEVSNVDRPQFPGRGVRLKLDGGYRFLLDGSGHSYPYLNADAAAYQRLDGFGKVVFATRLGYQQRFTDDFPFFDGAILGGLGRNGNLRGFRRDRFTGQRAFYHQNELRWKILFSDNRTLPFGLGLSAGFDYGRVWMPDDRSDRWHYSYGGSVVIEPLQALAINVNLYWGDGRRPLTTIRGSYFF